MTAELLSADEPADVDEAELAPYRPGRFATGSVPAAGNPDSRQTGRPVIPAAGE
jgi:hypothetical protein